MADDTSATTDASSQWAGLLPFLKAAAGTPAKANGATVQQPSMQQIANGMANSAAGNVGVLTPMQQHAKAAMHPTQQAIPAPFLPQTGMVAGPIAANGAVPGMIGANGVAGPLLPQVQQTPGSVPASSGVTPPVAPSATGSIPAGTTLTTPQAPGLNAFSLTAGSPMTANHFQTGMPNPTGAR